MSEEAKLEYLRQKIKEAKRIEIIHYALSVVGLVVFLIGFIGVAYDLIIMGVIGWASDLIIMGVPVFVISLVLGFYSNKRKDELMEQLRKMGYEEKEK